MVDNLKIYDNKENTKEAPRMKNNIRLDEIWRLVNKQYRIMRSRGTMDSMFKIRALVYNIHVGMVLLKFQYN